MSELPRHPPHNYAEPLSELQPEAFEWFWLNRLAFGTVAMLEGDPGEAKSLVALDLAARASTGRPMPDGSPSPGVFGTIILQSEDSYARATLPRLLTLGGDQNRVFRWKPPDDADEPFGLPSMIERLERELKRTGARLVIIDPLVDFLDPGISINSDRSIRRALRPLRLLAEHSNCLILMIRHLVKRLLSRSLYRGSGSIGITGVCRSCWLIGRDPEDSRRRILAEQKGNYSALQPSLAFELRAHENGLATPHWLGETHLATADLGWGAGRPCPERDRAAAFLRKLLHDGPRLSADVWAAAREHQLAEKTVRGAGKKIGVLHKHVHQSGTQRHYWLFEGQELPPADPVPDDLAEFHRALAEQVKKFPASCPLDQPSE
jgi:hypothetical protein